MNEKNMKKIINQDSLIIVGMILMVIVTISIGSFAYVSWRAKDDVGSLTTTIGDLATITFDNGINISSDTLNPVLNYEEGVLSTFSISKKIDSIVYFKSYLSINSIDKELISESLKYVLLESDDDNIYTRIADGSFDEIENNKLFLIDNYNTLITTTYYKLYIYIDGNMNNNNMQNKKIDAILNIGANKEMSNIDSNITSSVDTTSGVIGGETSIVE